MATDTVARLRSFNRTVTERVGALETRYLGRGRPLGESRLLWEIGPDGAAVRDLRRRLGLDSGYLSRLLRSLEQQGLATVEEDDSDARVRVARLTTRGRRERAELDRLSDRLAWAILEPLDEAQRVKLAAAAETVERLLRASQVEVAVEEPRSRDGRWCLEQYFAELAGRFDSGFDPALSITGEDELTPPRGLLLLGEHDRGQQAVQSERVALFPGEGRSFVERRVAQQGESVPPFRGHGRRLPASLRHRYRSPPLTGRPWQERTRASENP